MSNRNILEFEANIEQSDNDDFSSQCINILEKNPPKETMEKSKIMQGELDEKLDSTDKLLK